MDEFSLWSHRKAIRAIDEGRFKREIEPVPVLDEHGSKRMFDTDEHPRRNTSLEKLASLPPALNAAGRITAGNSSAITDGAWPPLATTRDAPTPLTPRLATPCIGFGMGVATIIERPASCPFGPPGRTEI